MILRVQVDVLWITDMSVGVDLLESEAFPFRPPQFYRRLFDHFHQYYQNQELSDLTFICQGGERIQTHKYAYDFKFWIYLLITYFVPVSVLG